MDPLATDRSTGRFTGIHQRTQVDDSYNYPAQVLTNSDSYTTTVVAESWRRRIACLRVSVQSVFTTT